MQSLSPGVTEQHIERVDLELRDNNLIIGTGDLFQAHTIRALVTWCDHSGISKNHSETSEYCPLIHSLVH